MNIIAIMGPHGVFYKDEPIKELESALVAQGFQIIWPQNSVDLLKFIEHNPRICGVIFDWDEYSLDLCSDINQLNEYLPLYAFINTHSTMDVSVQDMRMALWFFEYALGQAEDIAIRMRQYTNEYLDNGITRYVTEILVKTTGTMQMLGSAPQQNAQVQPQPQQNGQSQSADATKKGSAKTKGRGRKAAQPEPQPQPPEGEDYGFSDDIPF